MLPCEESKDITRRHTMSATPGHDPHGHWDGLISKNDAVRRDGAAGGRLPLRQSNECLQRTEVREQGGLYGIGVKVDTQPPHLVLNVSNLRDAQGESANHLVHVGDALVKINGKPAELSSMEALERAILGPKDSMLTLSFAKMSSKWGAAANPKEQYDVKVKRHVPIRYSRNARSCARAQVC